MIVTWAAVVSDGDLLQIIIGFVGCSAILGDLQSPLVSRLIAVGMKADVVIISI